MSDAINNGWEIEFNSGIPVYKQIINHVCSALASGALKPGDRLPTIRSLHQTLNVNPNTVAKAYRELELAGIIAGERGSGSFIQSGPEPVKLSKAKQKERLDLFHQRMLAEAFRYGLTEEDLVNLITKRRKA